MDVVSSKKKGGNQGGFVTAPKKKNQESLMTPPKKVSFPTEKRGINFGMRTQLERTSACDQGSSALPQRA